MAYIDTGAYDRWRKAQEQAKAAEAYNAQKAELDNKYNNDGLGGFLGSIVGGIGKAIGDVGKGVGGMIGTGAASVGDLVNSIKDGKVTTEGTDSFKRYWYGGEDDKDTAAKLAGTSLNAATTLASTIIPGAGAGTTAGKIAAGTAANTAAGAISGVADELEEQGKNASFEGATNRAISGAAAGLATGGLNKKLGNATSKVGSALLNNNLVTSVVGRGTLSGAVGGSVGAGTSAALSGGDVASAALQGGLTGSLAGATQAGIMSGVNKVSNKMKNSLWENQQDNNFVRAVSDPSSMKEPIYLGELSEKNFSDIASLYGNLGLNGDDLSAISVAGNKMYLTRSGAEHLNQRRIEKGGMSPQDVKKTMRNATKNGAVLPELTDRGNATMGASNDNKIDIAHIGVSDDGNLELMSTYPVSSGKTYRQAKNTLDGSLVHHAADNQTDTSLAVGSSALQGDDMSISRNSKNVNPDLMYGESQLGNRTKRGAVAEGLSRLGNTLEGAQTNVTRAAARDLGIESTGKVIENVRKKTGLTNLETQASLAKELTGGENSLMDRVQRQALSATEDGKPFKVDTSGVISDIDNIVNKYADANTFGSETAKTKFANNLKNDIANGGSDIITKANRMKASAADLRGRGITNPSAKDAAASKIYTDIANRLDDLSYNAIPQENVDAMFDATISEMRGRAQQAQNNGNRDIAKAYNTLADSLDSEPRTIKAYRSFKKDFVDTSKINQLTGQAENGAAFQMGSSFAGGAKRFVNSIAQRPVNAALAKIGGGINQIADAVGTPNTSTGVSTQPATQQAQNNALYNYIGRTQGQLEADNNLTNLQKARDYQNLEDMFSDIISFGATTGPTTAAGGLNGMNSSPTGQMGATSQIVAQLNDIQNGMNLALASGDIKAYSQLVDLYETAYGIYKTQNVASESQLSTSEKNQLAKLQSAGTALDELEALYEKAGGGQGIVGGNIANFLGGLGWNSDVSTYNQLSQGLINQIGAAIGKTDSLNTEGEVQRALSLVPKITDDQQTAMNKLATLRSLLQTNANTYSQLYGS